MSTTTEVAPTGLVVRAENAERIELSTASVITLLADSSATGGALSVHHTMLRAGTGASPHHHTSATEVFYIVRGSVRFLIGSEVVVIGEGDLAVVPPPLTHAFEVTPHGDTELLIGIVPGIERFEQWRQIARVIDGRESPETLADQSAYDTYADESPAWRTAHADEEKP
jgi:mannose-6-phosphate isomerase-like protein (cupin superfamily)